MEMLLLELWAVALITIYFTNWIYRWRNPKCKGILPPGSSGLPVIGETLQLIMPSNSLGVPPFIKTRLEKYGTLFRTNIAGHNVIVSADAEVNHFIFQQEGKLVERWYMESLGEIFKEAYFEENYVHKYTRGWMLSRFGADHLKGKLLSELEESASTALKTWSGHDSIDVKSAAYSVFLQIGAEIIFSCDTKTSMEFADKGLNLFQGFMCLPINIPGTKYHHILKEMKTVLEKQSSIVRDRLASGKCTHGDLLDKVLEDMKTEKFITVDFIEKLLFGATLLSSETISWGLALALKFLSENPSALKELTVEHEETLKKRENSASSITWEEYKSMTFTLQVINETLRMGAVIPGLLRRAKKDIKINGYTIPAGWVIMVVTSPVHFDHKIFKDPLEFNPWRWKDVDTDVICKNFKPFGGGTKQCAGAEYTRVMLSIFLHVLVTKYRWTKVGGGDFVQNPTLQFKNGLRIKITEKEARMTEK